MVCFNDLTLKKKNTFTVGPSMAFYAFMLENFIFAHDF